ncbi:MAG: hypothetical protein ACRDOI_29255 [Trebonia sp.]
MSDDKLSFGMTIPLDSDRFLRREHLKTLITEQCDALARSGQRKLDWMPGELCGFGIAVETTRVMTATSVVIEMAGAPGAELRMTPDEIASSDSGKLIVRMEGRLAGLEAFKTKAVAEIDRLAGESDRARDDIATPFAQTDRLAAARDRVQKIDAQMSAAAAPPRVDPGPPGPDVPEWAATALKNPDDPRWLAAAAVHDAAVMTGIPGASVAVIIDPEPSRSPVQVAGLDFPARNPVAGTEAVGSPPPARPVQPPSRGPVPGT